MSDFQTGEVSFDDIPDSSGGQNRSGSYLNMKESGDYKIRVTSKPFQYYCHWVETADGRRRKVNATCDATDPIIAQGKGPQKKWLIKVIHLNDESGSPQMKILDAGSQILSQIKQLHKDKENFGNVSKYDLIITKGAKGANPLYTVKPTGSEKNSRPLIKEEKEMIKASSDKDSDSFIDLSKLTTPWTADRINEVINGEDQKKEEEKSEDSSTDEFDFDKDDDFMEL